MRRLLKMKKAVSRTALVTLVAICGVIGKEEFVPRPIRSPHRLKWSGTGPHLGKDCVSVVLGSVSTGTVGEFGRVVSTGTILEGWIRVVLGNTTVSMGTVEGWIRVVLGSAVSMGTVGDTVPGSAVISMEAVGLIPLTTKTVPPKPSKVVQNRHRLNMFL